MALFQKKRRTSQQKAQRAQMGILARLLGCAYLVYIMVQLIKTTLGDENATDVALKITIAGLFLVASAVVITITVIEFVKGHKRGYYNAASYKDDFEGDSAGEAGGDDAGVDEDPDTGGDENESSE